MEIIALLTQVEAKEARDVSSSDVNAHDRVRHGEALINGHSMGDTIPRIQHDPRGPACGITEAKGGKPPLIPAFSMLERNPLLLEFSVS